MDISPLANDGTRNGSTNSAAATSLSSDFNSFIQLLTTQVTNQDPLNPVDSTQFTEQLATFSALEQQVASNAHLETISRILQDAFGDQSGALLGKPVSAATVSTTGRFDPLPIVTEEPAVGQLVVRNSNGQEVFRSAVDDEWAWDGTTSLGEVAPPDDYSFVVITSGSQPLPARMMGTVERVISTEDGNSIGLGENVTADSYTVAETAS